MLDSQNTMLATLLLLGCGCHAPGPAADGSPPAIPQLVLSQPPALPTVEKETTTPSPVILEEPAADPEAWRFVISPYIWVLSVDGTATVAGTTSTVDEDFNDILDQLNFVFEGRFEAWKGPWGVLLDITYAELENDADVGAMDVTTNTDLVLGVLGGVYRFLEQGPAEDGSGGLAVDGIFGVGYTSLDAEIDLDVGPTLDGDDDWFDPILGLRTRWNYSESWGGSLEAIIGGFELFDGSELFTMFTVLQGWKPGPGKVLYFGWRNLDIDYDEGDFEMDVRISGPIVGFEWHP